MIAKFVSSVIGGLLVAFVVVFASDSLFHALSPTATLPANTSDPDAMREYVASQPRMLLLGLVLGWALAALVGSAIAARFGGRGERAGWVVTVLFLLATATNFLVVQHPSWMIAAAIISILAAGWLGSRTGTRNGPTSRTPAEPSTSR